ncbi:MAG: sigma-70 family RNA polymerase sigma factor [Planctomycetes bacterium]|nr:sigma-70 family RNA polymerase sigma factor [Planctomycetota bacterium]MBL7040411.1 sigma-70 family RNA polymerase sigma factor [Pirellulaceae bacterium]
MSSSESVSDWLVGVKRGESSAVQHLWERYFHRLVHLARTRLGEAKLRVVDEEDIAITAFTDFCRAAEAGRFPSVKDRDDLWRLLIRITTQKTIDQLRRDARLKRGGGQVRGDSALADIVGDSPTPEFAALVAEETRVLLEPLDPQLRQVALAKLEGYHNGEIAERLECSVSTVERKLRLIREIWKREVES